MKRSTFLRRVGGALGALGLGSYLQLWPDELPAQSNGLVTPAAGPWSDIRDLLADQIYAISPAETPFMSAFSPRLMTTVSDELWEGDFLVEVGHDG